MSRFDAKGVSTCLTALGLHNPPLAWVSPKEEDERLGAILQTLGCLFRVDGKHHPHA
jgi:hypothetical protein